MHVLLPGTWKECESVGCVPDEHIFSTIRISNKENAFKRIQIYVCYPIMSIQTHTFILFYFYFLNNTEPFNLLFSEYAGYGGKTFCKEIVKTEVEIWLVPITFKEPIFLYETAVTK